VAKIEMFVASPVSVRTDRTVIQLLPAQSDNSADRPVRFPSIAEIRKLKPERHMLACAQTKNISNVRLVPVDICQKTLNRLFPPCLSRLLVQITEM